MGQGPSPSLSSTPSRFLVRVPGDESVYGTGWRPKCVGTLKWTNGRTNNQTNEEPHIKCVSFFVVNIFTSSHSKPFTSVGILLVGLVLFCTKVVWSPKDVRRRLVKGGGSHW